MKLSKKSLLVVSVMLFALFFGAGNLIFPPFLGQNAGEKTLPAMIGFLVTAVVLPVLGVVVVARFDGLEKLGRQVGPRFALVFAVLIYLSIGPGLGIPRAASVPFEMAVAPYLPEGSNPALWMAAYSLGFFLIALWLCLNPGKLVDRIGRGPARPPEPCSAFCLSSPSGRTSPGSWRLPAQNSGRQWCPWCCSPR